MQQQYKEFQGKSLDEAIQEACQYYGVSRGKLEIDIVSDAKSGIFGLVGAKKAVIRACRANLDDLAALSAPASGPERTPERKPESAPESHPESHPKSHPESKKTPRDQKQTGRETRPRREEDRASMAPARAGAPKASPAPSRGRGPDRDEPARNTPAHAGTRAESPRTGEAAGDKARKDAGGKKAVSGRTKAAPDSARSGPRPPMSGTSRTGRGGEGASAPEPLLDYEDEAAREREDVPSLDLAACDQARLFTEVEEVVARLTRPIIGPVPCSVSIVGGRVRAELDCGDAAGLLVGREGQTLASVQFLASRIVSRIMGAGVHVQIDAGRYRERQDDRIRELALSLAEKARSTGRPQSTRPLSAYQRRLVHLALEGDEAVQTRSSGEGPQRRVIISPLRKPAGAESGPDTSGQDTSGPAGPDIPGGALSTPDAPDHDSER